MELLLGRVAGPWRQEGNGCRPHSTRGEAKLCSCSHAELAHRTYTHTHRLAILRHSCADCGSRPNRLQRGRTRDSSPDADLCFRVCSNSEMPSNKSFRTKVILGKAQKQNR